VRVREKEAVSMRELGKERISPFVKKRVGENNMSDRIE